MIEFLFLDLDDTILDFRMAERVAVSRTFEEFGIEPTEQLLQRYHLINKACWEKLERKEWTREQVLVNRFQMVFDEVHVSSDPVQFARSYESNLGIGHYFLPGAEEAVMALHKKYRLYRVGNWFYDGGEKAMSVQAREIVSNFLPYMREKYGRRETFIRIDPACKALRLELDRLGAYTEKADNNAHDIRGATKGLRVGIEMLQSSISDGRFYIVDDDHYGAAPWLREVGLYCVDDHGNPVDAYNHCMDETRYANNYFYKNYVK